MAAALFGVALAALLTGALFPVFPQQLDIRVDDVAARTIEAPRAARFESEFLTEQRRAEAEAQVPPTQVFDPGIREAQLARYDELTAGISEARALTDDARRRERIAAVGLQSQRAQDIALALSEDRWLTVAGEGRAVLTETLGVSLDQAAAQQAIEGIDAAISPTFTADEALLAAELVRPLITTTLVVDEERTEQARAEARARVAPVVVEVQRGDIIVADGSRVDEVALEKLRETGLLENALEWENVAAVVIVAAVVAFALAGYLYALQPAGMTSERHLIALAVIMTAPVLLAKFYLPVVLPDEERQFLAYGLPVAAAPLLIAALLRSEVAVLVSALLGALLAFIGAILPDVSLVASVETLDVFRLGLVYALAALAGVYLVHRADRLARYFTAGLAVAVGAFGLLAATWLIDPDRTNEDWAWMALNAGVSGVTSGLLAAGAFVTMGVLFGITTRVHLMELAQLNAPLLRRLQDEAPGTFHHSIIVGNLAERAADLVGADALLTRVGSYYHDIGKVLQPGMYVENQMTGQNPHEEMDPHESSRIIKQHVTGGLELARRERLPARVQAFIPEHHGTRLVAYFYRVAAERAPDIDPVEFQYPGPRPQSRETAIVMLADSTEAIIRAAEDRSPERIDALVEEVIAERLAEGQLDECDLTMRDLRTIAESFKGTMRAVYHPRVAYPQATAVETRRRILRFPLRTASTATEPAPEPRTRGSRGRWDR